MEQLERRYGVKMGARTLTGNNTAPVQYSTRYEYNDPWFSPVIVGRSRPTGKEDVSGPFGQSKQKAEAKQTQPFNFSKAERRQRSSWSDELNATSCIALDHPLQLKYRTRRQCGVGNLKGNALSWAIRPRYGQVPPPRF